MKTTHRNYDETCGDFDRMARFVMQNYAQVRSRSTWCIGRIDDWRFALYEGKLPIEEFCANNACLWFDAFGELAGFAINENGNTGFAIITKEGYRFLFPELLDWSVRTWGGRGAKLSIEVTEHQQVEIDVLEQYGFKRQSVFFTRCFDLTGDLVPRKPLEPGFRIVDMASHPDWRAQRVMRLSGFQGIEDAPEELIQQQIETTLYHHKNGPIYHAETDLCVMKEDGVMVSGCEALIDPWNAEADIERVCTHSAYRKRGFARAAIQECLYRLKAMGMKRAYITGYSPEAIALYGSLGAVEETKNFEYVLEK